MASSSSDLWNDVLSPDQRRQSNDGDGDDSQQSKPVITVFYDRKTPSDDPKPTDADRVGRPSGTSRTSFAPIRRTSCDKSLSIRGRQSIVLAVGEAFQAPPKQIRGRKIPRPRPSQKKRAEDPPDFGKAKEYFQEVDSFELLEESPTPRKTTWKMGAQEEIIVPDLAAILKMWEISTLACASGVSQPLFTNLETPIIPRGTSQSNVSGNLNCISPKETHMTKIPLSFTSCRSASHPIISGGSSSDLDENSFSKSFDALRIKEVSKIVRNQCLKPVIEGVEYKDLEGPIRKGSLFMPLGGERLSAFAQLLMICQQSAPTRLSEVFSRYCEPSCITKLGEGTFGEAFRAGDTVCKVVPIDGDPLVNGEVQKKSKDVLEEVLLSLALNNLRTTHGDDDKQNVCTSFIETKDFWVCKGAYDAALIYAWEDWDSTHGSENDPPKDFSDDQCYIVFVLSHGGKDLESFVLTNFSEARSLLLQVTAALAVAEAACEFEHRDLHWGNILLTRSDTELMEFILQGKKFNARTNGLIVSIIDFTLSRINTGNAILFLDLSEDQTLFQGPKGDKQSETYRKMREATGDCWEGSYPETNVLWLVYLVDILAKKTFKRAAKDERDLRLFKKRLNSYSSAKECLQDPFFGDLWMEANR